MIISKISKRGQVVIPKKIRDFVSIKSGDTVKFSLKGNQIIIEKVEEMQDDSMVALLMRGEPFEADLVNTLRSEWE